MIWGIPSGRTGIDTRKSGGNLLGPAGLITRGHGGKYGVDFLSRISQYDMGNSIG
jgi:hypothetical protein